MGEACKSQVRKWGKMYRGLREEGRRPAGEGDRGGLISKEERGRYRCNGGHKISLLGALQYFFFFKFIRAYIIFRISQKFAPFFL